MKKLLVLTLFVLLATVDTVFAQGFQPPAEGKAVVYFTRVTLYGKPVEFEFFHQDKYIGVFKGDQYMRYECDPGNQLFWASSENKEFLTTELEAGKTYIVMVDVIMGVMKAHVGLTPVSPDKTEDLNKAVALVNKEAPTVTPDEKIEKMNKKLEKFIPKQLEMYESTWKNERNYKHLSADMAIPEEYLK
ncbi:MAG: hypothetical protein A2X13_08575 [Bacteroidetes bacterium GWC2_33_15]|nr:MAG: hypothetical protein A2X10_10405 [Bacteroidetes bacterium GWA2_33_15]OFX51506.1 MAG: hypothetical protein A2X13_08575 [Bacteroidetes bacterium GWC2_33_15]OFX65747.1 MAG: hypothetical protein A2X15_13200 [Bacteroidetes bacterium GWB2_32_14]OFX69534.1 MAG: hypothetical protein A2X14_10155 [Bacteroidetes bacterium GWD2_33_33]HAN17148.1 hypothetical protein [Bacteroidales bacterium]